MRGTSTDIGELRLLKLSHVCLGALQEMGYDVEICSDQDEALQRVVAMGKPGTTPMLSTSMNDFTTANSFWLFLKYEDRDAGCVASRFDDLGDMQLPEFWLRNFKRCYPDHGGIDPEFPADGRINQITGPTVYCGEFFIHPDHRGDNTRLRCFTHLLFCMCAIKFRFDWLYVFLSHGHFFEGYPAIYSFPTQVEFPYRWKSVPDGRYEREVFCAISRADILQRALVISDDPDLLPVPARKRDQKRSAVQSVEAVLRRNALEQDQSS